MLQNQSTLMIAYHLIQRKEPYRDLGSECFDKRRPEATKKSGYATGEVRISGVFNTPGYLSRRLSYFQISRSTRR